MTQLSDNPTSMRAIEIIEPGGPEMLSLVEIPLPKIKAGEILI